VTTQLAGALDILSKLHSQRIPVAAA